MPVLLAPAADLLIVLVFAAIGRRSHSEGDALTGVGLTAWPFLVGALVGWVIVVLWRRRLAAGVGLGSCVVVWLSTVAVGMLLRHLTDRGVAVSFIIVTLIFNGALMFGWRLVARWVQRRRGA